MCEALRSASSPEAHDETGMVAQHPAWWDRRLVAELLSYTFTADDEIVVPDVKL